MTQLYTYARQKLGANGFERDVFLNLMTHRTIRSVSRSGGKNIGVNRWLSLITALCVSDPDAFGWILDAMTIRLDKYKRTHKLGCLRMSMLISYIRVANIQSDENHRFNPVDFFTGWYPKFQEQDQESWILAVARSNDAHMMSCGHFESVGNRRHFQGTAETYSSPSTACGQCAQEMIDGGVRVLDNEYNLILSEFAVSVFTSGQTTRIYDRRHPHVRYSLTRQIYHLDGWHPYQGLIDSYHSSKNKGFKLIDSSWQKSNRRAFGCELEVEVRSGDPSEAAGRVHEALNPSGVVGEYCYFERDGSIGTGFEMVTQPAGLDVHREKFGLFLNNPEIKKGMRSHEGGRCGFHVHVGREYVTQSQIYRVQSFLNDVRNEALVRSIARRYSGGYCRIKHEMAKFSPHNKNTGERYEALNVQGTKTIEFRIFRGSLRYESIMAALEFVNAVLGFCTPGVTAIQDFTSIGFKKFVLLRENKEDTKFLRSYLALDANHDNELQAA